jgi:peptidyl-dipeptidase A/DNA-directed RNA polymerase III subunit RPC1
VEHEAIIQSALSLICSQIEITEKMSKSRNFDELKHVWQQWHEQSGGKMRHHYEKFVQLSNEAAQMNS